jgi:hypothetical protein
MEKRITLQWAKLPVLIVAPHASQLILETVMNLIDQISPQKWGPYGLHEFRRRHREHLLNLLLWFFHDKGVFPVGWICFTQEWHFKGIRGVPGWVTWLGNKFDYQPGYWVEIPPVPIDALARCQREHASSRRDSQEQTGETHG